MPRDVGEDLAAVGAEAAASATAVVSLPPRPRVVISPFVDGRGALALEAGDDDDLARRELGADAARLDAGDAGAAVAAVGGDAGLRPGQADRRDAERVERHRHERRALVLAGREQHVELARVGLVGDGRGEAEQLVGRVAHRRDDDDEVVAGRALAGDPPGDALDPVGVGDRRATELLDDERGWHGRGILPCAFAALPARARTMASDCQPDPPPGGRPHVLRPRQPPAHRADRRRRARRDAADPDRRRPEPVRGVPGARRRADRGRRSSILPDVRGLHPYYEELALRFAEHGIDALAIDWFGRTAGAGAARRRVRLHAARHARRRGPGSRPTSRPAVEELSVTRRRPAGAGVASSRSGSAWAAGCRSWPATLGLDLAGVDRVVRHARRAVAQRRAGAGRRGRPDRRRRSWGCSAARTRASPAEAIAAFDAALTARRRRPPARDLPGRPAQLLRPQGGRVRGRQRGGLGRGPRVHPRRGPRAA